MLVHLHEICCACLPAKELCALADVRTVPGVLLYQQGAKVWVRWEAGDERVLRCLLPIAEVVLYSWRQGRWYRPGASLPDFEVPAEGDYKPLYQVLFPAPVQALPAFKNEDGRPWQPVQMRLVSDHRPRPATALLASPADLLAWAELVPSFRLARLHAAWNGQHVLVLGARLPVVPSGQRLWGQTILLPLGFRLDPDLPESTVRAALQPPSEGAMEDEPFLLVSAAGVATVPTKALQPLHRAGLRQLLSGASCQEVRS